MSKIQEAIKRSGKVYVSITGLEIKSGIYNWLSFWRHAIPSKMQADGSSGILSVDLKDVGKMHHTLTVWEDKSSMMAFLNSGAHLGAMGAFDSIASGKVHGYETDVVPCWDEALALWEKHGRVV